MKHSAVIVLGLLFIGVVGFQPVSGASGQAGEWTTLFDGSSLDGWNALGTCDLPLRRRKFLSICYLQLTKVCTSIYIPIPPPVHHRINMGISQNWKRTITY